jgi:hypothetical protein
LKELYIEEPVPETDDQSIDQGKREQQDSDGL